MAPIVRKVFAKWYFGNKSVIDVNPLSWMTGVVSFLNT